MGDFKQGDSLPAIHVCDVDPKVGIGVAGGTPNILLIRTDSPSLYRFAGPADTDWVQIGEGSGAVSVNTDNVTIQGDGTPGNKIAIKVVQHDASLAGSGTVASPLSVVGTAGNRQTFRYARQVGDTDTIVIALPVARASVLYNVQSTQGEFTNLLAMAAPPTLYLVNQFTLKLSAAPVAGDTFLFTVQDLT